MDKKIYRIYGGISGENYCYDNRKENDINEIEQHIPSSCSTDSVIESFNTVEELIKIPFVKNWSTIDTFSYYAISVDTFNESTDGNHLMAVFNDGKDFWVLGYIKYPNKVDLPRIKIVFENETAKVVICR
jgi:hypothetical protein